MNQTHFICPACHNNYHSASSLNKHLSQYCEKYDSFIKHYSPPQEYKCEKCYIIFSSENYLHLHTCHK